MKFLLATLLTSALALPPSAALAEGPTSTERKFRGQVVTSGDRLDPHGEEAEWNRYLTKQRQRTIKRNSQGDWMVHFIAFLNAQIGSTACNVMVRELRRGLKPKFVENFIHEVDPAQRSIASKLVLSKDSFKSGKRYRVLVTRVIGKREKVYAKADITLK